jgi:predicted dehydrogenase
MVDKLTWGILGTGIIAGIFARGLAASQHGELIAVGSRSQDAAEIFGNTWQVAHCHGSYEQLLADPAVQAVYIATPHTLHTEWAIKAAQAGKHILCEKPIAINHAGAMAIVEAARHHDVFLMEAYMYRCHPQTEKLLELIRAGTIGSVRVIQATFSFHAPWQAEGRLFNPALGGGGILDVGGYCTSMARLIAGVATGQAFAEPLELKATGHIGALSGVDEYAIASLSFPGGIVAQLFSGIQVLGENEVHIFGSEGSLCVPVPWVPKGRTSTILLKQHGEPEVQEIMVENPIDVYALEADTVAAHIHERQAPAMTWSDTLGNMKALDRWREAIGLVYDQERPEGLVVQ